MERLQPFSLAAFEPLAELLAELGDFRGHDSRTIGLSRVSAEVALMVVFCRVKSDRGDDLRHKSSRPDPSRFEFSEPGLSNRLLFAVMEKNCRAILRANIVSLSILCGRVVDGEENLQQVAVADDLRIKLDLDNFRVSGSSCADLLISRIDGGSTHVARNDTIDANDILKNCFEAPETATC